MERSWHIQSIYPKLAAGSYLPQSWHLSKLTMLFKNRFFRHVWLKTDLSWSHKFPNPQLNFKKCRYKAYFGTCTTFSASSLFRRFSMSARSGPTRYHNALLNKISSDCTSWINDGLMHTVFTESFNLSQVKDSDAQIDTIHWHIAEINPVLIHWWGWYAILLLCRSIRCLVTLLSYTHRYYSVVVYSFLLQCWAIPIHNTLLS